MKKIKKSKKKEHLIMYFSIDEKPTKQDGDLVFFDFEIFKHETPNDTGIISVALNINLYLDLLLSKKEFNTFTGIYFSYHFIGSFNKSIENQLYVNEGHLNGTDSNGEFNYIAKL